MRGKLHAEIAHIVQNKENWTWPTSSLYGAGFFPCKAANTDDGDDASVASLVLGKRFTKDLGTSMVRPFARNAMPRWSPAALVPSRLVVVVLVRCGYLVRTRFQRRVLRIIVFKTKINSRCLDLRFVASSRFVGCSGILWWCESFCDWMRQMVHWQKNCLRDGDCMYGSARRLFAPCPDTTNNTVSSHHAPSHERFATRQVRTTSVLVFLCVCAPWDESVVVSVHRRTVRYATRSLFYSSSGPPSGTRFAIPAFRCAGSRNFFSLHTE